MRTDTFIKANRIIQELIENIKREAKIAVALSPSKSSHALNNDGIGSTIKEACEPISQLLQINFGNLMAENAVITSLMWKCLPITHENLHLNNLKLWNIIE